jgi:hypothetical protein
MIFLRARNRGGANGGRRRGRGFFERVVGRMGEWARLEGSERARARKRFGEEWGKLAGSDGRVREEGRLFVGVGRKR